jgi:hypothetical protein
MKKIPAICTASCLVLGTLTRATAETFRTDINPALQYYQALIIGGLNLQGASREFFFTNEWRGRNLDKEVVAGTEVSELLSYDDRVFTYLRHASKATVPCDWGIDLSPGPGTLLPHLGRFKALAQTARLRAMWDLQHDKEADARDDLLATFVLARQVSRDGFVISALVQIAMENIVCATIAENFNHFSPATLQELADGMAAAPERGKMAAAIGVAERQGFGGWLARRVRELQQEYPGNDKKVMEAVRKESGQFAGLDEHEKPDPWEKFMAAAGGTSAGVLRLIGEVDRYYVRLTNVMTLPWPEYESKVKDFNHEVETSQNPFVVALLPALPKTQVREFTIEVKLAMVRAAIEYKLHGQEGFKSVGDPCGNGPFAMERFVFYGGDRGFKLKSALDARGVPEAMIFVEKDGPPFFVDGPKAGEASR